jgi:hypothetical protein
MNTNRLPDIPSATPDIIVGSLLRAGWKEEPRSRLVGRTVATLEREAPRLVELGRSVNVNINYLGIAPLFDDALMMAGEDTDWIVAPVSADEVPVVPREQREALNRLDGSGAHFPMLYVAHEVEKDKYPSLREGSRSFAITVPKEHARKIVGPTPAPVRSVELADRLSERANQVFKVIGRAGALAGTVAVAPLVLLSSAMASLSTLDPVVLGAIPALLARPGEPAAWYVLARWDW